MKNYFEIFRTMMVWNDIKDELLCREILLLEPYKFKARSRERGNIWKQIAEHLNEVSNDDIFFKVDNRAVRDRFNILIAHYNEKMKEQEKASGISPEPTPLDEALESILDRMKIAEEELEKASKENEANDKKEVEKAEEMRKKAMETFSESKARKHDDFESPPVKRSRSSGSDTIQFLREKAESDRDIRQQELELQRSQQEQQSNMFMSMMGQMQQAQQQNQQMLGLMFQLLNKK